MQLLGWKEFYALVLGLLAYILALTVFQWYRLRKVPGPLLAHFSNLWLAWAVASAKNDVFYQDLARRWGRLVRIGPTITLTDDPEVLRRMSGARSAYGKDTFYQASLKHPDFPNMFTSTNVAQHDAIKAKLMGPYGGRETTAMEPIVDGFVNTLVQYVRGKITTNPTVSMSTVDLAPLSLYFTVDVITRLAFGQELGFLRSDSDVHHLLSETRRAVKVAAVPQTIPWARAILTSRPFLRLFGPRSTDKKGLGVILRICESAVKERYQPNAPDGKDLLGAFVRQGIPEGPCISEAIFALTAASDTTASAIRSTMLHLMTTPRVYDKFKGIVLQAVSQGDVSSPIKQEEAKKISYLQAIIYEGLRLRPPAPILFSKVVPPQGDIIDGKAIPGGTAVGMNLPSMMRRPDLWGPDAEIFRPERFSEADDKTRLERERLVDLVFGYGRFGCAGKPLAWMELNKVFFELFRYFDFQLVNPAKPWDSRFMLIWMEDNMHVRVTETQAV